MALSEEEFKRTWKNLGEDSSDVVLDVAWRRYQQVHISQYTEHSSHTDPSFEDIQTSFKPLLTHPDVRHSIIAYKILTIPASIIPWMSTGIFIEEDQPVSVFATGRTWRSRLLDMYLPPQFALWYRIGVNGEVFNSTRDTRTFKCIPGQAGELYVAPQFPGQFGSQRGGRVQSDLSAYEKADGCFQILVILWKPGMIIRDDVYPEVLKMFEISKHLKHPDPFGLLKIALSRLSSNYFESYFPVGWSLLWFLGMSEVFTQEEEERHLLTSNEEIMRIPEKTKSDSALSPSLLTPEPQESMAMLTLQPSNTLSSVLSATTPNPTKVIRCCPSHNVGILQKDLTPVVPFAGPTTVSWSWNILSLPSRLREDTTLTHDYLSIAFEFNNGRDLTYTWSWELPEGYGYWCPLPTWKDREYHVVLRSGTERLGEWIEETRDLWKDYAHYINDDDEKKPVPEQVVRVWLIAGNRWQRHKGEMLIKRIMVAVGDDRETTVL